MVKVTIGNQQGKIENLPEQVTQQIIDSCSYFVDGAQYSKLYRQNRWDGRRKLYTNRGKVGRFPMGLWDRIKGILDSNDVKYKLKDNRDMKPTSKIDIRFSDHMKLRDYQSRSVDKSIKAMRSIIQVATGGGKTVIASGLIDRLKCNTLFIVHTKDLMYQTIESFEDALEGADSKIGQLGDGVIDIQPVTVATTQTISRILNVKFTKDKYDDSPQKEKKVDIKNIDNVKKYLESIDLLIWDEVHRVACEMAYSVSNKLHNPIYRVGLSASPWRDDGADIMIEASMGKVSTVVSATELIELGYLVKPVIKIHRIKSSVPWEIDNRTYDQIYRQEIVDNEHRNRVIMQYMIDFQEMNIPTLILVQQIRHGEKLKRMITEEFDPIDFLSGRDYSSVRNNTIQEMREERMGLIATTIADEGLDIKRLSGLILAGGGKSSTRALQRIGRVLRPYGNKTHALVVDFYDEAKYLRNHAEKRKEIYNTEPKFDILEL